MRLINAERYAEKIREHANVLRDENPTSIVAIMAAMSYDIAADEAMKEPTIDAAPVRHGRWETFKDVLGFSHYQCSECGDEWRRDDKNSQGAFTMRYCPKCGSKNDGGV